MANVESPFAITNIRLFLTFRVLFNARFYYPIFSILFLDFGLTLSQFAILNAVWAATIVVCEVPSGALADILGRRNLLVMASMLMVVEIGLWAFVPRQNLTLLFWVFVLNRILSGMAEAAASGADEALAYDSLALAGKTADWGVVLERQGQLQAAGFVVAMTLGGVMYDPELMSRIMGWFGVAVTFSKDLTLRLPIYGTLVTALLTLFTTLRMQEVSSGSKDIRQAFWTMSGEALRLVWQAGVWIFHSPLVIGIILFGLLYDSVVRMILTMASQYYRAIDIPEAWFGILGSVLALFGFVMPMLARRLVGRFSMLVNFLVIALFIVLGLAGIACAWPVWGVVPALILFASMNLTGFMLSFYLNNLTSSQQRATVLSFKGLFLNAGYGIIGVLYGALLAFLRYNHDPDVSLSVEMLKNSIFVESLPWFLGYFFLLGLVLFVIFGRVLAGEGQKS